jgi:hypothetical protein
MTMLDLTVRGRSGNWLLQRQAEKIQLESFQGKCSSGMHNIDSEGKKREVGSRNGGLEKLGQIRCVLTSLTDKI